MTISDLEVLVHKWQERMRLLDWDIAVTFATKEETETFNGLCIPFLHSRTAEITIANEDADDGRTLTDVEITVVHELLHIYFAPFKTECGTLAETAEEQAINALSHLLVALDKRRGDLISLRPLSPIGEIGL